MSQVFSSQPCYPDNGSGSFGLWQPFGLSHKGWAFERERVATMAFSAETVLEDGRRLSELTEERKAARQRSQGGAGVISAYDELIKKLNSFAPQLTDEGIGVPDDMGMDEVLEFAQQVASSYEASPSDEIKTLQTRIKAALDSVGWELLGGQPEDEVLLRQALSESNAVASATNGGNGGTRVSKSDWDDRNLGSGLLVECSDGSKIESGFRKTPKSGDWGSVMWEVRKKVLAHESGSIEDYNAVVKPLLQSIKPMLRAVDKGELANVDETISDSAGQTFRFCYPAG